VALSVQLRPELRVTDPVGAVGAAWVSVTVIVQLLDVPTWTEDGTQTTVVLVGSGGAAPTDSACVAELPAKPTLPTNVAVIVGLPA
jgi:hypothetical protein